MQSDHVHTDDIFIDASGRRTTKPPKVVVGTETLRSDHNGSVCVERDSSFVVPRGVTLNGTLSVQPGAEVTITGKVNGTLSLGAGASVEVTGSQSGTVSVARGAVMTVRAGGMLAGTLTVEGTVENFGDRGGVASLIGGTIRDHEGSRVKEPVRKPDGSLVYVWP